MMTYSSLNNSERLNAKCQPKELKVFLSQGSGRSKYQMHENDPESLLIKNIRTQVN